MPTRLISSKASKKTPNMTSDKETSQSTEPDTTSVATTPAKASTTSPSPKKRVMKRNRTPPLKINQKRKKSSSTNTKASPKAPKKKSQPRKHIPNRKSLPLSSNRKSIEKSPIVTNTAPLCFPSLKNLTTNSSEFNKNAIVTIKQEPGIAIEGEGNKEPKVIEEIDLCDSSSNASEEESNPAPASKVTDNIVEMTGNTIVVSHPSEEELTTEPKTLSDAKLRKQKTNKPADDNSPTTIEGQNEETMEQTLMIDDSIPDEYVPSNKHKINNVIGFKSSKPKQLQTLAVMAYLRKKVYDRKVELTQETSYQKGHRFPLKYLLGTEPRPELKILSSKFYMENKERIPNAWIYYFPSTSDLKTPICNEFFEKVFPDKDESSHIDAVHSHQNTECLCISLHDSVFHNIHSARELKSQIICMISFRMLQENNQSGVYIYYLGTVHSKSFHEVMPSSKSFAKVHCPVEGQGMGEFLLQLTQLFVQCVNKSCNVYLAVNKKSTFVKFYKRLGFKELELSDEEIASDREEIENCASLEASDLDVFKFMKKDTEMTPLKLCGRRLLHRHCDNLSRDQSMLPKDVPEGYSSMMKLVVREFANEPYKADKDKENNCFLHTNEMLAMFPLNKEVDYVSNGNYWTYYHKMWSEDTLLSYWNVKAKFKEAIEMVGKRRSDRRKSNVLPLEEVIMDYSCLGRVITDNKCENNNLFNIHCSFCDKAMTKKTLSKR